jgi:RpiB/LacA/LacB family sugar-phosphate isomerase
MSNPARHREGAPSGESFVLGCDHAGYELKERVKAYLLDEGNEVEDLTPQFRERIDFPPVAEEVGRRVAGQGGCYGILTCGTGLGMCMAANKVPGIRAALLYSEAAAEYARRHNDANVLAFGGRTMAFAQVRRCLEAFFSHRFEGGRYAERNAYIRRMERH